MSRLSVSLGTLVFLAGALAPGASVGSEPREKIGVILHDHGAPREHNAVSYYGMKWFLDSLVMMGVMPEFLVKGFPFDPFAGNWGVVLMDRNRPYEEVPWAQLQLIDAWGVDRSWLKYVDVDPATPGIQPPYKWTAPGADMYRNAGHYLLFKYPYQYWFPSFRGWREPDFYEYAGFDFYADWQKKGGVEVYFDQALEQRRAVRDALWREYKEVLSGVDDPLPEAKELHIRLTQGIDSDFPNSDPAMSMHAQSLRDAIVDLVKNVGVRELVVSEYFVVLSEMMNDMMDRYVVMETLDELATEGYTDIEVTWAPDKTPIGQVTVPMYQCSQWPPYAYPVGTQTKTAYVGGVAFNRTFSKAVVEKTVQEYERAAGAGDGDIAFFLSNHGVSTTLDFCFDSANDYIHYSYKAIFIDTVRRVTRALHGAKPQFGPDSLGDMDMDELLKVENLGKNIQYATTRVGGRTLKFFRTAGQYASPKNDPGGLAYSPREALQELLADNAGGARYTNVVDLLYNFFGDSGDLLIDQRLDGYGHNNASDPLYLAAWAYCNPFVQPGDYHDCSKPEYAGLEPYETELDWSGVHVRITNASWGFEAKERAVTQIVGEGIERAAGEE